jgi:cytochrome c oxidase subunit II
MVTTTLPEIAKFGLVTPDIGKGFEGDSDELAPQARRTPTMKANRFTTRLIWFAATWAVIGAGLAAAAVAEPPLGRLVATANAARRTPEERRVEITASRFSYNPSEITLKKGEPVVLVLTSTDVTHGLAIKDFDVKTEIKKGKTAEVTFTPLKVGTFQAKCSHFCGKGHGSMVLTVNVVE